MDKYTKIYTAKTCEGDVTASAGFLNLLTIICAEAAELARQQNSPGFNKLFSTIENDIRRTLETDGFYDD